MVFDFIKRFRPSPEDNSRRLQARWEFANIAIRRAVAIAGWTFIERSDSIPFSRTPDAIVIGIAIWSDIDHRLIAELADYEKANGMSVPVFAFDVDDLVDLRRMNELLPGAPLPSQTPIVVEYRRGKLHSFTQGVEEVRRYIKAGRRPS